MAPAWLYGSHRLIGLSPGRYLRQIGPPLLASTVVMGAVFAAKTAVGGFTLLWQVVVLVAVGVITYTGALWFGGGRAVSREALELARLSLPKRSGQSAPK
jgi:hypothetical protein